MKGSDFWASVPVDVRGVLDPDGYARAALEAIEAGHALLSWSWYSYADLEFAAMNSPLAIGNDKDFVYLYGVTAEMVDRIAILLGNVVSPTPKLFDIAATRIPRVLGRAAPSRWVGPFTQSNVGYAGMLKTAAKLHSDKLINAGAHPLRERVLGWGKVYALKRWRTETSYRKHHACLYGWSVRSGGKSGVFAGRVIQDVQYPHTYRDFFDYSEAPWYLLTTARYRCEQVDLRAMMQHHELSRVVSDSPVPYIIHPDCRSIQ